MPPISFAASSAAGCVEQPLRDGEPESGAEPCGGDGAVEHLGAHVAVGEHVGEQLVEVEHLDAALGERVGERVVLLARALDPEDVVEQQRRPCCAA